MDGKVEITGTLQYQEGQSQDPDCTLRGLACADNSFAKNLRGLRKLVILGAIDQAIAAKQEVCILANDDPPKILGRTSSETTTLCSTADGPELCCQLDKDNSDHINLWSAVQRRDFHECSWAFTLSPGDDDWDEVDDDENPGQRIVQRPVRNVSNLMDASVVTHPTHNTTSATSVSARDREQWFTLYLTSTARHNEQSFEQRFFEKHGVSQVSRFQQNCIDQTNRLRLRAIGVRPAEGERKLRVEHAMNSEWKAIKSVEARRLGFLGELDFK
jgi:HK97 family phage prohead protease